MEMQRKWYRSLLEKDINAVNQSMVSSQSLGLSSTYTPSRFNGKEGRNLKDPSNEYDDADVIHR